MRGSAFRSCGYYWLPLLWIKSWLFPGKWRRAEIKRTHRTKLQQDNRTSRQLENCTKLKLYNERRCCKCFTKSRILSKTLNPEQYLSSKVPSDKAFTAVAIPDQVNGNLEALDTNVKSMMAFICLPNMWKGRSPCRCKGSCWGKLFGRNIPL